jgi:hypothetical protein
MGERDCEEIEKAPDCARLHRILLKGGLSVVISIQLENGEYTASEKETLEELLQVHFPGSEIILEPSGGWNGLELELPKWKGTREDWAVSRRVKSYDKLKWAVFLFQPYKSPGFDGIMPIMLQQGFDLLGGKLLILLINLKFIEECNIANNILRNSSLITLPELVLLKYLHCKAFCDGIIRRYKCYCYYEDSYQFLNSKTI